MSRIVNLEANVRNALRAYPFTDDSALSFDKGFIPNDLILDARIYCRGSYGSTTPCELIAIRRSPRSVEFTVGIGKQVLGKAVARFGATEDLLTLLDGDIVTGCLVIDPSRLYVLEAVPVGEHILPANTAAFVPIVVELLPGPVVTSLTGTAGDVALYADVGLRLVKLSDTDIEVSVVGDPHFTRYGCDSEERRLYTATTGAAIKQIRMRFWTPNEAGELVQVEVLVTPGTSNSYNLPLFASDAPVDPTDQTTRPALRVTTSENTVTISLAGIS